MHTPIRLRMIAGSAMVGVLAECCGLPLGACVALVVACQIVWIVLSAGRSPG